MSPVERGLKISEFVESLTAGVSPLCDIAQPDEFESGVLTLAAVTSGRFDSSSAKRIDASRICPDWPRVRKDTVLVGRANGSRSLVGASSLVEQDHSNRILADKIWELKPRDGRSARFLHEFLRAPVGRRAIHESTRGSSGMWNLPQEAFLAIRIPAESIRVEKLISWLSECFDKHIVAAEAGIRARTLLKRGLMQKLLTGQKRFPEFIRCADKQPGQFGTVPKDWEVLNIGEIAKEASGRGASEGSVVYSCTKYDGLVPSMEYFGKQVFSRNLDGYKRLVVGDFAYATNHIEEGSIGLLRQGMAPGLVSPMYTVFTPSVRVVPEFLYFLLKIESYRRVFAARMSASVDRRGSLRWAAFSRIKVGMPSVEEQTRIVDVLRHANSELDQLARLRELIEMQKRSLLSRLLSGEIRVPA